jgi:hypothetical protein
MKTILLFCIIPYLLTGFTGCVGVRSVIQTVTKAPDGTVTTTTAPMPDQKAIDWAQQIAGVLGTEFDTPFITP